MDETTLELTAEELQKLSNFFTSASIEDLDIDLFMSLYESYLNRGTIIENLQEKIDMLEDDLDDKNYELSYLSDMYESNDL